MRILSFGDMHGGCWMARVKRPLVELAKRGHFVALTDGRSPVPTQGWDIVLFNNLIGGVESMSGQKVSKKDSLDEMVKAFRKGGAKIVYDTDDAQDIIPDHIINLTKAKDCMYSFDYFIENADLITTTTEELAGYLRNKTDIPVKILPNCLDPKDFPLRKVRKVLRIGLAGSVSHIKDVMIVMPALHRLSQKYKFEFAIMGFSKGQLNKFVKLAKGTNLEIPALELKKALKKLDSRWIPSVDIDSYPKALSELGLDIGIAPLEDIKFNKYKSCIKRYEYGLVGTLAITSNSLPYSAEYGMTTEDWEKDLERLITDVNFRKEETIKQTKWVLENRDITKEWIRWQDAYTEII